MYCWRITAIFLLVALLALTACGGSAVIPDPGPSDGNNLDPPPAGQWAGTAGTGAAADPGFTGVPEIPLDGFTVSRVSSEIAVLELLGSQYLQKYHAEVVDTTLILDAPESPEEGGFPIAYGLYRFSGLQDAQLQWLNIECMPRILGESYYVGLADYTIGDWLWFGPVTFPEFQLDLRDLQDRLVTELGNMYFIVVCEGGNGATLSKSSLTIETGGDGEGWLPGAPHGLVATDGAYPEKIVIEWEPGYGAGHYELWRAESEEGEWDDLAVLEGTRYEDLEVIPGQLYWYKAFAVNEHGKSNHSNIDEGYAGVLGEDPGVPPPFDLVASDGTYLDKVRVEWEYEGDYGYFQLWRMINEEGYEWHKIADTEVQEYNDFEVEAGVIYVYKARAIRGEQESDWSNHDTGYCCEGGGGPEPPFDLVASDGTYPDKVRVEWMHEGNYGYFQLWRKVNEEGYEWHKIADTEAKEYNDFEVEVGVVYVYKARAILEGQESDWSNHDTGYCCEGGGGPEPPFDLVASDGAYPDKVRVEWGYEGDYGYFDLWRRKDAEGHEWQRIATPEVAEYNDYEVLPGYTYIYKVRVILEGQESDWSNHDTGYCCDGGGEPNAPFELVASDGTYTDKVRVEWMHEGNYGYFQLWRKANVEGSEWHKIADTEAKEYNDFEVEPGVVYVYKARAILEGQESDWSNHDTGYCCECGGGPNAPFELVASDGTYPDKVRVEWMHEGNYGYFQLWRKANVEGSEWHKIADTEAKEHNDFTAAAGTVYLYKARAILEGQESEWSNQDTGFRGEGGGGPEAPWNLAASDGTYTDKVRVEWMHEGNYGYFELWRMINEEGHEWQKIAQTEAKEHNDFEAVAGTVYIYKARAILKGQESGWSNQDTGYRGEGGGGPEAPWELVATDGAFAEKVVIEWSHEGDYGYFELWRRIAEGEHEWALLDTTEGKHYYDYEVDPGVVYAYKARAVLGEQYSDWSNIDHGHAGEA